LQITDPMMDITNSNAILMITPKRASPTPEISNGFPLSIFNASLGGVWNISKASLKTRERSAIPAAKMSNPPIEPSQSLRDSPLPLGTSGFADAEFAGALSTDSVEFGSVLEVTNILQSRGRSANSRPSEVVPLGELSRLECYSAKVEVASGPDGAATGFTKNQAAISGNTARVAPST